MGSTTKLKRLKRKAGPVLPSNYRELQALARERGIKANQKKDVLIAQLSGG